MATTRRTILLGKGSVVLYVYVCGILSKNNNEEKRTNQYIVLLYDIKC